MGTGIGTLSDWHLSMIWDAMWRKVSAPGTCDEMGVKALLPPSACHLGRVAPPPRDSPSAFTAGATPINPPARGVYPKPVEKGSASFCRLWGSGPWHEYCAKTWFEPWRPNPCRTVGLVCCSVLRSCQAPSVPATAVGTSEVGPPGYFKSSAPVFVLNLRTHPSKGCRYDFILILPS